MGYLKSLGSYCWAIRTYRCVADFLPTTSCVMIPCMVASSLMCETDKSLDRRRIYRLLG
jgi:hypothetical protein